MTSRERFMLFAKNKPVDRAPVAFFHHFCDTTEWMKGMVDEKIFEKNIEGHRKAREVFDPDVIKVMNDSLMIMPVDTSFVTCASDLRKINPPMPGSLYFEKSKELTKRTLAFYEGNDAPKYITGFSPFMILKVSISKLKLEIPAGKTTMQYFIEQDADAVVYVLDKIADAVIELNKMLLTECGAEGVYLSVNNQGGYLPDEMFTKYASPSEKRVLAEANKLSDINILHICGYHGLENNLELFKDYDAPIINWAVHVEGVGIKAGKALFGGKPICAGFAQDTTIYTGTKEEVMKETKDYLSECGQTGVMIGADCTVPTDIDDNRLEWVREAAIEFGKENN